MAKFPDNHSNRVGKPDVAAVTPSVEGAAKKAKRVPKPADLRPIPVWRDPANPGKILPDMRKTKGKEFPSTRDGRAEYFYFTAAKFTAKAVNTLASKDPNMKRAQKIDKLEQMLALLKKEQAAVVAAGATVSGAAVHNDAGSFK